MPKIKFLEELSEEEENKRLMIINSLKRDGFLNDGKMLSKIAKKSDVNETFSIRFNWREKRILIARMRRIASKSGMSINAWIVMQLKELIEVHDYEHL
jgi:predicted HicB family RNase H-like nuclease